MSGVGLGLGITKGGGLYSISGTIIGATEQDIIDGGRTLIIKLGGGLTWHANIGSDSAETTALLDGIVGEALNLTDWDSVVRPALNFNHVVRTDAETCTITLPAVATYLVPQPEQITVTPPAAAVVGSSVDLLPRKFVIAEHPVSLAVTGTAVDATQGQIRAGGRTIILTLTNGVFDAAVGAADNAETAALLGGLSGDGEGDKAFDAEVLTKLDYNDVALSGGNAICTITLDVAAAGAYNPLGDEEITVEVPASIVVDHSTAIETDAFTIVEGTAVLTYTPLTPGETDIVAGGQQFVGTISNGVLGTVAQIAAGLSFQGDQSLPASWNNAGPEPAAAQITRDSDTQFTWTMPAAASYEIEGDEVVQPSLAASALEAYAGTIADPATFTVSVVTVSQALSGTASGATQTQIRAGGRTIISTLTDGTFEPTIGQDNEFSDAVIAALSGDGSGDKRFDAELKPLLDYTMLALSGGNTILTITLPSSGYNPLDDEDITFAPTAQIILNYSATVNSDAITVTEPTASIEVPFFEPTEQEVVDGGLVMVGIITDGILGTPAQIAAALSFDGDLAEANSWDTSGPVPAAAQISRDSETQFTWTLPAAAAYSISTDETVTPSFAASGLEAYAGAIVDPDPFIVGEFLGDADSWDELVDGTSIQTAINGNPTTLWIKRGVYDEDLDFDQPLHCYFEPETEIDDSISAGDVDVTVPGVCLEFGTGCLIDGDVTLGADGASLIARNNLEMGILVTQGEGNFIDGGGLSGGPSGAISIQTDNYQLIEDIRSYGCTGLTQYCAVDTLLLYDSLVTTLRFTATRNLALGCVILDAGGANMVRVDADEQIIAILSVWDQTAPSDGAYLAHDHCILAAAILKAVSDSVFIQFGADNCIVGGLREDGGVLDFGTGSVVGSVESGAL